MKIDKSLLEKIINLRDLRQAITAVRKNAPVKKADEDTVKISAPKPDLSPRAKEFAAQVPRTEKPKSSETYGLKYLGKKRTYNGVIHMIGIPGEQRHYEVNVNHSAPKIEHTVRLAMADGSTISRSPNVHGDIRSAIEDIGNHFGKREWHKL